MFLLIKIQLTLSLFCPLLSQQESEFQAKFIFIHFRDFLAEGFETLSAKSGSVKMLFLLKKEDVFTCERTVLAKIKQCLEKVINSQERKHSEHYLRIRR